MSESSSVISCMRDPISRPDGNRSTGHASNESMSISNPSRLMEKTFGHAAKVTPDNPDPSGFDKQEITVYHGFDTVSPLQPRGDLFSTECERFLLIVDEEESPAPSPSPQGPPKELPPKEAATAATSRTTSTITTTGKPPEHDVWFGIGTQIHPGNKRRAELIMEYYPAYNAANDSGKTNVCKEVVAKLRKEKRRFWNRVNGTNTNVLMEDDTKIYVKLRSLFRNQRKTKKKAATKRAPQNRAVITRAAKRYKSTAIDAATATATGTGIATVTGATTDTTIDTTTTPRAKGVTQLASGKFQAQIHFCGKVRYIGVFGTHQEANCAFVIARNTLSALVEGVGSMSPDSMVESMSPDSMVHCAKEAAIAGAKTWQSVK